MKITELEINPETTIVLGVFETSTFIYIRDVKGAKEYGDKPLFDIYAAHSVMNAVTCACSKAEKIIFILDEVIFPINDDFFTGMELIFICKHPNIFDKTIFVKGDNVIDFDKNLVL
jgi:hypothetical protein